MAESVSEAVMEQKETPKSGHGAAPHAASAKPAAEKSGFKKAFPFIFGLVLLVGAIWGWKIIEYNKVHENTDDAQIDAEISPIIPRVAGYVASVSVHENDHVDSNALLVTLDAQDLELKVKSAEAAVENADAAVRSALAAASAAKANIASADVHAKKTAADVVRGRQLFAGNAMTKEQLDAEIATADMAAAQVKTLSEQATATATQVAVATAQAKLRRTELDNAKLQLSYARITAPLAGTVAKKNVEVGEYIQPGTPLMAIIPADHWITANFKETQLEHLKPGQHAEFTVDAYGDHVFHATVQSVSPATGAKFSLLPPDNASGNFIKVTQRVPVKLLVDHDNDASMPLRPGMSVDITVTTGKE